MSDLTKEEMAHIRAALRFLKVRCGSWDRLSKVTHYEPKTLLNMADGSAPPTVILAFRLARLAQVPTDDVIGGRYPAAGACAYCGHTPPIPPASQPEQ